MGATALERQAQLQQVRERSSADAAAAGEGSSRGVREPRHAGSALRVVRRIKIELIVSQEKLVGFAAQTNAHGT